MQINRYVPDTLDERDVADILSESVGEPTAAKVESLMQSCNSDLFPGLWVARCEDAPVGILRLDAPNRVRCFITHIAVRPECRGQGIGRALIEFIRDELRLQEAEAETDGHAVAFYKACGFAVKSLGEKCEGVQRYRCVIHFRQTKPSHLASAPP